MGDGELTERWVFGGSRVAKGDKRVHEWIEPSGETLWFKASGAYVVGSIYDVVVRRDGERTTKVGTPRYTGERTEDAELLDRLSVEHRAAELRLTLKAKERADKRDDPLEKAIDRLAELAVHVPPPQRRAVAVYVALRLMR
jgi:hypothetical protein